MPQLMLIELIYHVVLWLDAFPMKSGVSATMSPQEILLHHKLDFAKHCKALFGSYCKVHDEPVPSNMMATCASPAIVLGPTGNLQGTYKLLNLATGKKIKRCSFTAYPMPDSVIKQIKALGQQNLPGVFVFLDRNGVLFEWNDNVDEYTEGLVDEDVVLYPSLAAEFPGITLDRDIAVPFIEEEIIPHGQAEDATAHNANVAPFVAAGVNHGPAAIHAKDNEIGEYDNKDDGIIVVADIPHGNAPPPRTSLPSQIPTRTLQAPTETWILTMLTQTMTMKMVRIFKMPTITMRNRTTKNRETRTHLESDVQDVKIAARQQDTPTMV